MVNWQLIKGLASYIPSVYTALSRKQTGGSARYDYSLWLRHLEYLYRNGVRRLPNALLELGPGENFGVGLAAMLSGVDRYCAVDAIRYPVEQKNLGCLEELLELFQQRQSIPGDAEFPVVWPKLETYAFPDAILTDDVLRRTLGHERVERVRRVVRKSLPASECDVSIQYIAPWDRIDSIEPGSVDLIISQVVLMYIDELERLFQLMHIWLRPGGVMSHRVSLHSHNTARQWNGHWKYSDSIWRLFRGRRPYFINREPASAYLALLEKYNFKTIGLLKKERPSEIARRDLAPRYRSMTEEDLRTSDLFIQAMKVC